ncbi:transporter substrate-binding domain-containing protein [Microbispora cellulosiformans]|uniref:Transporter substrate-binding domain-containing protein n=1 Tax=Microbispora cellulosiformans TaxID=2614688 RepID=A0A5J5K764_9ACTN|nr:transporter substrate-binding domain-containing protein [Microbispora cellulosiformans]KAA9380501.1 transporter substrate-binding domain-containing protein [Microbispora cellulosiformans]
MTEAVRVESGKRFGRRPRRTRPEAEPAAPSSPPAPPAPEAGPPRRRGDWLRLYGWLAAIMAAVLVGGYILFAAGPPTEAELREQARLTGKKKLLIGVKDDTPGIALRDKSGAFSGFDIDIAYMIAGELGFRPDQVEFLSIETEDRARRQATDADGNFVTVDLVVATFSITAKRLQDPSVGLSSPYLYTEQSVVTRADHARVTSLGQLAGEKVCTLGTSTSEGPLAESGARVTAENKISACFEGLEAHLYDAVSTDAAIMAGFVAKSGGTLTHHDIGLETTEMWAVNTGTNTALRTLVELALYRSYADPQNRMWEEAYDRHIRPMLAANPGVNVAQSTQPCLRSPQVRRWPWERALSADGC